MTAILANQKRKPHYLSDKEEFLKYVEFDYFEPEKPYSDLKAYILKHKLTRDDRINGIDSDLLNLHEMIKFGVKATDEFNYFTERDYHFEGIDDINDFAYMVMDVQNNTRMYDNNGFTPREIFEKFERPNLMPLSKEPFSPQTIPKVGRNDPCPCGTGLKYKNCHGE